MSKLTDEMALIVVDKVEIAVGKLSNLIDDYNYAAENLVTEISRYLNQLRQLLKDD